MEKLDKLWAKFMKMSIIKLYPLALVFNFIWCILIGFILHLLGVSFSQNVASTSELTSTLFLVPMCALVEEMLFRWLPFMLFFTLFGKINREKSKYGILAVVIISSGIFGYVHGNIFNVLIQGVSGVILCAFYLRTLFKRKAAGKRVKYQVRPLLSSTLFHTLSNTILIAL